MCMIIVKHILGWLITVYIEPETRYDRAKTNLACHHDQQWPSITLSPSYKHMYFINDVIIFAIKWILVDLNQGISMIIIPYAHALENVVVFAIVIETL